jgi:hypothetical protein
VNRPIPNESGRLRSRSQPPANLSSRKQKGPGFSGCGKTYINADEVELFVAEAVLHRLDSSELQRAIERREKSAPASERWWEEVEAAQAQLEELATAARGARDRLRRTGNLDGRVEGGTQADRAAAEHGPQANREGVPQQRPRCLRRKRQRVACGVGGARELGNRVVERVPSALGIEHAAVALIEHDRQRPALEPLPPKPRVMRPRLGSRVIHQPMTQQQLREPVTSPHQITTRVLARTDQITRGLFFQRGHPDRSDLAEPEQARQPLSVPPVGLDPVGRLPDPRWRRNNAVDPRIDTRARKPVPSRPRLVHDLNRRRQLLQPPDRLATPFQQPQRPNLTALPVDHAGDHRASVPRPNRRSWSEAITLSIQLTLAFHGACVVARRGRPL